MVRFLHGSCVAPHKGSFIFKVSVTFSIAKQLLKESHEEKRQQKPRCLWMTLNEQNTLLAKFGLLSGTTVVQATALQLQLFALGMLYAHKIHYSVLQSVPSVDIVTAYVGKVLWERGESSNSLFNYSRQAQSCDR